MLEGLVIAGYGYTAVVSWLPAYDRLVGMDSRSLV